MISTRLREKLSYLRATSREGSRKEPFSRRANDVPRARFYDVNACMHTQQDYFWTGCRKSIDISHREIR